MTERGEQPGEARRAPIPVAGVGQSFADAWAAASAVADPYTASFDLAPESASPAPANLPATAPAIVGSADVTESAGRAVSVTVSRAPRTEASAAGSAQSAGGDRLTVEIRREAPGRPAERTFVTVSLDQAAEQVVVTF